MPFVTTPSWLVTGVRRKVPSLRKLSRLIVTPSPPRISQVAPTALTASASWPLNLRKEPVWMTVASFRNWPVPRAPLVMVRVPRLMDGLPRTTPPNWVAPSKMISFEENRFTNLPPPANLDVFCRTSEP